MFWDFLAVLKHRYGITTTDCILTEKSAVLVYFVAEPWKHEQVDR
jgi:hypothetical protein